jgi:hypothetical protein
MKKKLKKPSFLLVRSLFLCIVLHCYLKNKNIL